MEIGRQALPVIANECIVRVFYFIRRLINEIKEMSVRSISDIVSIDWNKVKPYDSPTLTRMLTVATAVFTAVDITDAIASKKYFVAVNIHIRMEKLMEEWRSVWIFTNLV